MNLGNALSTLLCTGELEKGTMQQETEMASSIRDGLALWETSHGQEMRGTLLRMDRHKASFEVYTPSAVLQNSEVLSNFKLTAGDIVFYSGRAVVKNVVHAGTFLACEVALEESWLDLNLGLGHNEASHIVEEFDRFMRSCRGNFRVLPNFKLVVADLQILLMDLRSWLEQVELQIRSDPSGDRLLAERDRMELLAEPLIRTLGLAFQRFEDSIKEISAELGAAHSAYVKRQLHPLVLCAPFMYRTYAKPLGYAGDYEMVNMMVRPPWEGATLFAKALNAFFLSTPPVVAHQNRVKYLTDLLIREACRVHRRPAPFRVFNLGCGPAKEVQNFLAQSPLSEGSKFVLMDFSTEALNYVRQVLSEANDRHHRKAIIEPIKKSVGHFLKEASRPTYHAENGGYDLVYCAGLFDYLPDHVCRRLIKLGYEMLAPGGVLSVTNVAEINPARGWMEYVVDWHLIYRNHRQMEGLVPSELGLDNVTLWAEESGVNYLLELRKPAHV